MLYTESYKSLSEQIIPRMNDGDKPQPGISEQSEERLRLEGLAVLARMIRRSLTRTDNQHQSQMTEGSQVQAAMEGPVGKHACSKPLSGRRLKDSHKEA